MAHSKKKPSLLKRPSPKKIAEEASAFVALGSNLGDRLAHLKKALARLKEIPQTRLVRVSSWYETPPAGGPAQRDYLNGTVELATRLTPHELLLQLQKTERELGRPRKHVRWGPRAIDLDILSYNNLILETENLSIPHPRMHKRAFVLEPLIEIAPNWIHPAFEKSAQTLLKTLQCKSSNS